MGAIRCSLHLSGKRKADDLGGPDYMMTLNLLSENSAISKQ